MDVVGHNYIFACLNVGWRCGLPRGRYMAFVCRESECLVAMVFVLSGAEALRLRQSAFALGAWVHFVFGRGLQLSLRHCGAPGLTVGLR